jgi:hypothetical protein
VPYGCKLEDLLAILHDRAPAKADVVALQRRRVEHGLLSVGLKIHYLGNGRQFFSLVERLGGASKVLEINGYKHAQASLCLVLTSILLPPPVSRSERPPSKGNRRRIRRLKSDRSVADAIGAFRTLAMFVSGGYDAGTSIQGSGLIGPF